MTLTLTNKPHRVAAQVDALESRFGRYLLYVSCVLLIVVPFLWRLWYLRHRYFDQDELEHLHAAWSFSKGLLPYKDFFEVHPPALYITLAPLFRLYDVETNVQDALRFLFLARHLSWLAAGGILLATFELGRQWRNAATGLVAAVLLTNTELFLATTLEVRPDVISTACWLCCVLALVRTTRAPGPADAQRLFLLAGVLLGTALMFTQKLLFATAGIAALLLWYVGVRPAMRRWMRILEAGWFALGCSIPVSLILGYFWIHDGLAAFVHYNLFFAADFGERFSPLRYLWPAIYNNPYFALFAAVGILLGSWRLVRGLIRGAPAPISDVIVLVASLGPVAGLFVMPIPYSQYFLTFLPLVALLAANVIVQAVSVVGVHRPHISARSWAVLVVGVCTSILVALFITHPPRVALYWSAALLIGILFLTVRAPMVAVTAFVMAISVAPLSRLESFSDDGLSNKRQLEQVRYVLTNTTPADRIMDGFSGFGVFRPHAHFYFMIHRGVRLSLPPETRQNLLADLQSGEIAPTLIVFDADLRAFSPQVTAFLERHYEPTGAGEIWRRKSNVHVAERR